MWSLGAAEFLYNPLQVVWPADDSGTLATVNLCQHWSVLMMVCAWHPARERLLRVCSQVQGEFCTPGPPVGLAALRELAENCRQLDSHHWGRYIRVEGSCSDIKWMCYSCTTVNYFICFLSAFCNKMENVRRMKTLNYWACFYSSPHRLMTRQNSSWLPLSGRFGEHIWNHIILSVCILIFPFHRLSNGVRPLQSPLGLSRVVLVLHESSPCKCGLGQSPAPVPE